MDGQGGRHGDDVAGARLRAALTAVAEAERPVVVDLDRLRADARRVRTARVLAGALVGCLVVALGAGAWRVGSVSRTAGPDGAGPAVRVTEAERTPVLTTLPAAAAALAIGDGTPTGGALARTDPASSAGPWSLVVRAADGSFGRHGAVVTYPVERPSGATDAAARPVPVGDGVTGRTVVGGFVWPVGDGWARIRGDLPEADLAAVAAGVRVRDGRPVATPPGGFRVVVTTRSVPDVVAELRYASADLGAAQGLGAGLTYTGLALGGGFEDALYEARALAPSTARVGDLQLAAPVLDASGRSRSEPVRAVASGLAGGNGTVAWEVAPGVVGYVGWSGALAGVGTDLGVTALVARCRLLDAAQWAAADPQVVEQPNGWS